MILLCKIQQRQQEQCSKINQPSSKYGFDVTLIDELGAFQWSWNCYLKVHNFTIKNIHAATFPLANIEMIDRVKAFLVSKKMNGLCIQAILSFIYDILLASRKPIFTFMTIIP